MNKKFNKLITYLKEAGKQGICLSFSGGVDSSLLLYLCIKADSTLKRKITAITFKSVFQTQEEINYTVEFCKKYGIKHKIIEFFPLKDKTLIYNPKDRCYFCKKLMFSKLINFCEENNIKHIFDGTNNDDVNLYRPGLKALKELNIISPFVKFEINKKEIRQYAKISGLKNYNKPSTPCLATRFPYNEELCEEKILMIKKGEDILKEYDLKEIRLRLHNNILRIEINKNKFNKLLKVKDEIIKKLKNPKIKYITLDLEGIRSGSMDETIDAN